MKVSCAWLQTFFDQPLPQAEELAELLTFHSSEVEEIVKLKDDTVLDLKVLPDKSPWLLSARGVAKELSAILNRPLTRDPFTVLPKLTPTTEKLTVSTETSACDYYSAALMTNVRVGPSPTWLKERLMAIGQRSINNVVDATNYVMFELGQPLHAFAADRLGQAGGQYRISVRAAKAGESIITLTGESYLLTTLDTVIVDATNDLPIGIAGIKGGRAALVDSSTTSIIIEAAHFNRYAVRNTAKRLKLQTDASKRYENGISVGVVPYGLSAVVKMIEETALGKLEGISIVGDATVVRSSVTCSLSKIISVLGLPLTVSEVEDVLKRLGYVYTLVDDEFVVTPPFERDDLVIPEDVIEEIGRIYGFEHIVAVAPKPETVSAVNARQYYAEKIRAVLLTLGWSEIFTSSFRAKDLVHIKNALASDKSYLRSRLEENIREAVVKNIPHRDLLGLPAIKIFEIGTVFDLEGEAFHVGLGVQTGNSYKAKVDEPLLQEAKQALESALGLPLTWLSTTEGVGEFSLDAVLPKLPVPEHYAAVERKSAITYTPFSIYPPSARDIALWVNPGTSTDEVVRVLNLAAGPLRVRTTLFDEFTKEGRVSYAFRLVFQATDRTLTEEVVEGLMQAVYQASTQAGFVVR